MRHALLLGLAASALAGVAGGDPPWELIDVESSTRPEPLVARVLVEAEDGGLLVEQVDQRLEILGPDSIGRRRLADPPPEQPSAEEVAAAVVRTLPRGFSHVATKHYVVCYDTSRAYAQWCAALFERLHEAFASFWRHAGLELHEPGRPLVVVIFADRKRYEESVAGELGAASRQVVGYYNLLTNRVTTYDLTGSDAIGGAGRSSGRAGLEILASRQAAGLVATLVHEATHQMAFNSGLHRRLAPVPLWVSEGIAIYFETPDLASDRGWRGIGGVNHARRDRFIAAAGRGWLEGLVRGDEAFRDTDTALDAYARAWAATAFLLQTRRAAFVEYLRVLSVKEPLAAADGDERLAEFTAAFGATPAALEEPISRFVSRLK